MDFILSLQDFSSQNHFLKLQNKFLLEHFEPTNAFTLEIIKKDFSITYEYSNDNEEESYKEIYFYKNFLRANIKDISLKDIHLIKKDLKDKYLFKVEERKNFINHRIDRYKRLRIFAPELFFLYEDDKTDLIKEIDYVLEFLCDDSILKNPYPDNNKMKIKMSKSEIHMLFILLRQAKIVDYPTDSELGRFIDNFFLYYNSTENEYKEIKRSNKDIGEYKNNTKSPDTAISSLKELLHDKNFYIYNP